MKRARPNVKEAKEALSAEQRDYHYYHTILPLFLYLKARLYFIRAWKNCKVRW